MSRSQNSGSSVMFLLYTVSTVVGTHAVVSLGNNWSVCQFYSDPIRVYSYTKNNKFYLLRASHVFLHALCIFLVRHRKDELEKRMSALQESRRELMVQLEGLMRLLKV